MESPGNGVDQIHIEFSFRPLDITSNSAIVSMFDWGIDWGLSWGIMQYGSRLVFKLSSDGVNETVLISDEILNLNQTYIVEALYDGRNVAVYVNDKLEIDGIFTEGLYNSGVDIVVGAELKNDIPVSHAKMAVDYIIMLKLSDFSPS